MVEKIKLNLFKGTAPESFILDISNIHYFSSSEISKILDMLYKFRIKEKNITEKEFESWCSKENLEKERALKLMRAIFYIMKKVALNDVSIEEIEEDLNVLNIPENKKKLILEFINKYKEEFKKELIKAEEFKLNRLISLNWRIDLRIRDKYIEQIYEPSIIFMIRTSDTKDEPLVIEFEKEGLRGFLTDITKAYNQFMEVYERCKNLK